MIMSVEINFIYSPQLYLNPPTILKFLSINKKINVTILNKLKNV